MIQLREGKREMMMLQLPAFVVGVVGIGWLIGATSARDRARNEEMS